MRSTNLLCVLAVITLAAPAFGADEPGVAPAAGGGSGSNADLETAKRRFNQGQVHYSLGEYEEAIAQFRAAYQLSLAPGLLFNVAQAYRLKGDCRQALEVYRHFLRLAPPDAPTRTEAEGHVTSLEQRCGGPGPAPVLKPSAAPPAHAEAVIVDPRPTMLQKAEQPAARPRSSTRDKVAVALLAAGAVTGIAAGALYLWNDNRYDHWRTEDQLLMVSPTGSPMDWADRQQKNDELLRSIQQADTVDKVLAGAAVGCVLSSAVLGVLLNRSQTVDLRPGRLAVTWRWP